MKTSAKFNIRSSRVDKKGQATLAGTVELKVPKLRSLPFEMAIIERYRRRESSVEE